MERFLVQCCCPHEEQESDAPTVERAACCESHALPAAQAANANPRERSLRAPNALHFGVVGLPPEHDAAAPAGGVSVAARARERGARAGPDVPLYDLHCVYLI
jgi:hypothetical protein